MKKGPITPKGFRDIKPEMARKRRETINKIADVLENFGFVPLETPTIEFANTLLGKYGEEEKLIYKFTDRGGRELALRYDLTVPLARFVANNLGLLNPTFSRYQIGQVFRGENPQKGRFREFTQFDFDTVGSAGLTEDAKVIAAAIAASRKLGLHAQMAVNDRKLFRDIPIEVIRAWDKFYKIGEEGVRTELIANGLQQEKVDKYISQLKDAQPTPDYYDVKKILEEKYGLAEGTDFFFDRTLARGLDYYTGIIMELKPTGKPEDLSIGGGGRYDNLIGMFVYPANGGASQPIPAVGFSFGIDRLTEIIKL